MSSTRSPSWSAARRDMQADRTPIIPGFKAARALAACFAETRRPLVAAGQYDRSAIMQTVIAVAKSHQLRTGATWADSISLALCATWQAAKVARAALVN